MKKVSYLLLLLFFSVIAVWPFLKPGYFSSHDGDWMVIRFSAFHQTLAAGQFPVRFLDRLNNNYGYPVSNFLYPLPFYAAEVPKALKFGFVDSIKVIFVLSTMASTFAIYWCLKQRFGPLASFTGAIVYLYIPYRFVDLYVRGSLGESMAFLFPPICIGSIYKIKKGNLGYLPILSIATALLILSHNVIAIIFVPIILFFIILLPKYIKISLLFMFLGFLISAFFWIPALYDLQFVQLSQIKVSQVANYLVDPLRLLVPAWGFGPDPNSQSGMSVQLGLVSIGCFVGAVLLMVIKKRRDKIITLLLIVYALVFFLLTNYAQQVWLRIPFIDIIQFPWRLLAVIVFISAYLAAYIVDLSKTKTVLSILLIVAAVTSTILYITPKDSVNFPDTYYSTNESTTTVRNEYMPLWVKETPTKRADTKFRFDKNVKVSNQQIMPANYRFSAQSENSSNVQINTIYFPGWQVKVNGKSIIINNQNRLGLITFKLPKGRSDVIIKYNKSSVHLRSELISFFGILATGFLYFYIWRSKKSFL